MRYTGIPLRYKFTVVELKRNTATAEDVSQLLGYARWVAGRLAESEMETVQPVLIAHDFRDDSRIKARNADFNERGIYLARYEVKDGDILLNKESY